MRKVLFILPAVLYAAPVIAQAPDWSTAKVVEVDLSSFAITPNTITLERGTPYRLHLVNKASGGHDFVAREFFAQATLDPASRSTVQKGEVDLGGGETADLRLVATQPGTYRVHCSHFMHAALGMKGRIIVR